MVEALDEAAWRKRYRAPNITLPIWAQDVPEHHVYVSNSTGKWEIYAWDRSNNSHRQVTDRPEGTAIGVLDRAGEFIWWFNDEKGNELGNWMIQPFEGGEDSRPAPELAPIYGTGLAVGTDVAIMSGAREGIHRLWLLRRDEPSRMLYEHNEACRAAGLSRDETLFAMSHSEHGDSRNRAVRVLDLEGNIVHELWDGPRKGLSPGAWSRVSGDQRLIVTHDRHGQGRPGIWSPEKSEYQEIDVDLPGEVMASWYPDAAALLFVHIARGRGELYRYDIQTAALQSLGAETGMITAAAVRPDGEVWYQISTSSSPSQIRAGSKVLLEPAGEQAPKGVRYRDVQTGDVHAFFAQPEGAGPYPSVVQIHGGPSGIDADMFNPGVQAWVDHGFAVVLVNYRGSWGYGKAWRDAIVGRPGFKELEDIAAVHDLLIGEGLVDPQCSIACGGSWGGYLTLLALGTQPERWSLGISGAPLADLVAHYYEESEPLQAYSRALFGGSPEDAPDVYRGCSPITYVDEVRVPVLILAGENDPRCPIGQVENYLGRLEELNKEHEVYRYDAGHGSLVMEEQIHQMELRLDFAARHLGTTKPL